MGIDIVGIGCRFPGQANDAGSFWELISGSESAVGPMPERGWDPADYLGQAGQPGKSVTFNGGWLTDIDRFDYGYFRISPREAAEMDPQQRLVLEVAHEALHDAGLNPLALKGRKVGVYVGSGMAEHMAMAFLEVEEMTPHTMQGNSLALIANRLSFVLDIDGPSLMIDSACSAAMSALDLGCSALRHGECEMAIVVGVNTMLGPSPFIGFSQASMLSPRGLSAPFDESADGFARGEGCGAIVLRRSDCDWGLPSRVYARVLGCGTNEDGRTASLTVPKQSSQAALFKEVLAESQVAPEQVVYVEAHGTGTPVGDPIEAQSIAEALVGRRAAALPIGSAKGHVGHLETAAGIVGLCKAALCLHHRQLVPTANHHRLSSRIDAERLKIRVPVAPEPMADPEADGPAAVAVCSYGFGGANAFALLGAGGPRGEALPSQYRSKPYVVPLSAHYRQGLESLASSIEQRVGIEDREEAARWAGALLPPRRFRRVSLPSRPGPDGAVEGEAPGVAPRLLMAFGGQGSQAGDMGRALYSTFEPYRQAMDEADACYEEVSGRSLLRGHRLCQAEGLSERDQADVTVALPSIVLTQVATASLLRAAGVVPEAVIGHSTGEMVAAWHCGALSLEELCRLTFVRAELQSRMRPGAMAAWEMSREAAEATISGLGLEGQVCVAGINGRDAVTLAGDAEAIESMLSHGKAVNLRCTRLPVPKAYHSHHVEEILPELRQRLAFLSPRESSLAMVSSVLGRTGPVEAARLDADYWVDNIARPVDFLGACEAVGGGVELAVEVSPRPVLSGYLGANLGHDVIAAGAREASAEALLLDGLGALFVRGVDVDWTAVQPPGRFVAIPRVPWDHGEPVRSTVWKAPLPASRKQRSAGGVEIALSQERYGFLAEHRVEGNAVMPGAGLVAMTLGAGHGPELKDLRFERMVPLAADGSATALEIRQEGERLQWHSAAGVAFSCGLAAEASAPQPFAPFDAIDPAESHPVDVRRLYDVLGRHSGLELGGPFRSIAAMRVAGRESIAKVAIDESLRTAEAANTVLLDGCLQSLAVLGGIESRFAAPLGIGSLTLPLADGLPPTLLCHTRVTALDPQGISGDMELWDPDGTHLGQISGLRLSRLDSAKAVPPLPFLTVWQPEESQVANAPTLEERLECLVRDASRAEDRVVRRVLDCSKEGLLARTIQRMQAAESDGLAIADSLFVVMTAPLPPEAPACVVPADAPGVLSPHAFDVVIADPEDDSLRAWLAPGGTVIAVEEMAPPPDVAEQDSLTALQCETTAVFFASAAPRQWSGPLAMDLNSASLVIDDRDDLQAASALVRDLSALAEPPGLVFVVRRDPAEPPSPIMGFARAVRNEHPQLSVWLLVLDRALDEQEAWQAIRQRIADGLGQEFERDFVAGAWRVPRLRRYQPAAAPPDGREFRLDIERPGQLSSLFWRPLRPDFEGLDAHEVRLRVRHVSLNFKDVMLAMGLLSGFKTTIGMECCGEIIGLGAEVAERYPELALGRRVMCISLSSDLGQRRSSLFGTTAVVDARSVFLKPGGVADADAAGFIGVYATAWHALSQVARLQPDETVLIHSGAGGVGQAAIQIARQIGAKVIASAGSEARRAYLRDTHGVDLLIDSHAPERFVEEVAAMTEGRGVDVALNSLSGEGLRQTLRCIAPAGRHVEIGKRDILEDSALGLLVLKNNITFHSVHLDMLDETHPERVRALIETCVERLAKGEARPVPTTVYPATRTLEAFRLMSSGKHTGKVIVDLTQGIEPSGADAARGDGLALSAVPDALFARDETQLVTGGTGGLGIALARFMAARGAGRLLLISRGGKPDDMGQLQLDAIRRDHPDCRIETRALDITDSGALEALFAEEPGITGVFHAATSYQAERAAEVEADSLETWRIKVQAAWKLHELTRQRPMRHFVLVTSLAGLHGNVNQAVYVAANAALTALARDRRDQGLPAMAIDFPILLGAGRLSQAKHLAELDLNTSRGFGAVSFTDLEPALEELWVEPDAHPPVVSLDRPNWASYGRLNRHRLLYDHLVPRAERLGEESESQAGTALSHEEVAGQIQSKIAFVLGATPEEIELDLPLIELGIDSLAAIELVNWLGKSFGMALSQTQILSGATARTLVDAVVGSAAPTARPSSEEPVAEAVPVERREASEALPTHAAVPGHLEQGDTEPPVETATAVPLVTTVAAEDRLLKATPSPGGAVVSDLPGQGFIEVPLKAHDAPRAGHRVVEVPNKLGPQSLGRLIEQLGDVQQVTVLRAAPGEEHFCLGMDLDAMSFGDAAMSEGLEQFERLADCLTKAKMPVIAVVEGACRGGGMLLPSLATITLASDKASFGFPEIRAGGLPGLVSVYARRRLGEAACQRYMLTGDAFDATTAQALGFVDKTGNKTEIEQELQRLLRRFQTIDPRLLSEGRQSCPAETPELAMIAMGGLDRRARARERDERPLVRLLHNPESGVLVIELNDPDFSNAIDWAVGDDLARAIAAARDLKPLRAVVLQGAGDHFCVGVNPYNFIRRTKELPVLTAARAVHDIYDAFVSIRTLEVPVVSALHGKVMGGGMAAALIGDYRIAASDALFNYGNLPRGVCPGMLLSESLSRTVGPGWATELYLNDFTLTAEQAKTIGLVNDIARSPVDAKAAALELASRIASYAPTGVRATTQLMRPPIDYARLARESIGIARCNVQGNAFAPGWKAEERRLGAPSIPSIARMPAVIGSAPSKTPYPVLSAPLSTAPTAQSPTAVPPQQWDWESDVRLRLSLGEERRPDPEKGDCVFLTGATGFVGSFILRELLERPATQVVCLVRARDAAHAMERIEEKLRRYGLWQDRYAGRVEAVAGNVGEADLGLDPETYVALAKRCNVVLHNGAMVDFTQGLDALRKTNVEGVRQIARFAAAHLRSQLVHVSSLSVFSLHRFDGEATDLRPDPTRLINGYARSKWLGEQVALLAWRQGLDVTVVRPGRVMGDSASGASNVEDWFSRYLLSTVAMGMAWNLRHETDMSPVDAVARLIVSRVGQPGAPRCWHAYSPVTLTTREISDLLRARGYAIRDVSYETWMATLKSSVGQAMLPLAQTFEQLPIRATEGAKITFSSDLPEAWRTDGRLLLNRMLDWMAAQGILPEAPAATRDRAASPSGERPTVVEAVPSREERSASRRVGIHAMELYFPPHMVKQADMERFHDSPGKYTAGLGQEAITFCADNEDPVSMALTAVHRLIERTGIGWDAIGRLEVGTESLVDRSKSIKTLLMSLFEKEGNCDVEGVDNYTACYGGTAAFLNSVAWCQSEAWDGRYALVVAVDIADLDAHQAFLNGAAAVAMLIGPDAPLRVEPERATHMMNTWDFYKPIGWKDSFPLMRDGKHSIDVYMACLEGCYRGLAAKLGEADLLATHDYAVFHCTSTYLCKRAFDYLAGLAAPDMGLRERLARYKSMAAPATLITRQIGSTYTASCYVNLFSLLYHAGEEAIGKRALVFSYGSGAASSLYRLSVDALPDLGGNLEDRLAARIRHTPESFTKITQDYSETYARFDFTPAGREGLQEGVYYLDRVDRWGMRYYSRQVAGARVLLSSGSPLEGVLFEAVQPGPKAPAPAAE